MIFDSICMQRVVFGVQTFWRYRPKIFRWAAPINSVNLCILSASYVFWSKFVNSLNQWTSYFSSSAVIYSERFFCDKMLVKIRFNPILGIKLQILRKALEIRVRISVRKTYIYIHLRKRKWASANFYHLVFFLQAFTKMLVASKWMKIFFI